MNKMIEEKEKPKELTEKSEKLWQRIADILQDDPNFQAEAEKRFPKYFSPTKEIKK